MQNWSNPVCVSWNFTAIGNLSLRVVQIDIIPLNINSSLKPKFGTEPSYYDQRLLFISGLEATWPCGLIWEKNVEDTIGTRIIM